MENKLESQRVLLDNLEQLVSYNFCVGCGLCTAICPTKSLRMIWNRFGTYEPVKTYETCSDCFICTQVCPFSDGLVKGISNPNEDQLGEVLFGSSDSSKDSKIGHFQECYAGYAKGFRQNSTSGGMTSWILAFLLETGRVDKVICVQPDISKNNLFEYRVCSTIEEVCSGSKSRYYPVHQADVLTEVMNEEARYALVALPCFCKGIRFAQKQIDILNERIIFCVGLFCGGMKSSHFTEYLAAQVGVNKDDIIKPQYRIKHEGPTSRSYSFGCANPSNKDEILEFQVKHLGDLWGPGFFKPNACDYCDDITSELADISCGDAWIPPYSSDWRGNNIIITRSVAAQRLIDEGLNKNLLSLEKITSKQVYKSLLPSFEHRRNGLAYRLYWALDQPVPKKRIQPCRPSNPIKAKIYRQRMRVRQKSQETWLIHRDNTGIQHFNREIRGDLNSLRRWQYVDRTLRKVIGGLRNIWAKSK